MRHKHLTTLGNFLFIVLALNWAPNTWAHQMALRHQYWWIKGPDVKSWRQDLLTEWNLNQKQNLILDLSHFERFNFEEQIIRIGWRKITERGYWELTHADGGDNRILAIRDSQLTYGQALQRGISGWLNLKAQGYSTNDLHMLTAGLEKEWQNGFFLIPFISLGRSSFSRPADTRDVWAAQIKLGTYREGRWKIASFFAIGEEYQALVALNQTTPLKAKTYGLSGDYFIKPTLRIGLLLDRSYYPTINTRFDSAQVLLNYDWGQP